CGTGGGSADHPLLSVYTTGPHTYSFSLHDALPISVRAEDHLVAACRTLAHVRHQVVEVRRVEGRDGPARPEGPVVAHDAHVDVLAPSRRAVRGVAVRRVEQEGAVRRLDEIGRASGRERGVNPGGV